MKRLISPLLLALICAALSIGGRPSPSATSETVLSVPVNMTLEGDRLYVSDAYTGLHVYDVSNLTAPAKVIRIPLKGNRGSAVKDDIVYANEYAQLLAIRVAEDGYTVVARIGNPPRFIDNPPVYGNTSGFGCACSTTDYAVAPTSTGGNASSYATFALIDNELYRVDDGELVVYDVTAPEKPKEASRVPVGWVETIHPTPDYLFIGGIRGMYIFDRLDPKHPTQISQIEHARACDPVVVSGSTAYVTLRGSNACGATPDELLCVSIQDPRQPAIIGTKSMTTPWGLAVRSSQLYVSHGDSGYSLVDVSNPESPSVVQTWAGQATRDFIWSGNTLFVLTNDNVDIYDVSDPLSPTLLSKLEPDATP